MYVVLRNFVAMDSERMRTPVECAKVIAFLASDAARVGQTIEVNEGQLTL
jgi:NAD(P)-dependent dehydrogenase (short-subunit alcohol dehydrogenase family)